MTTMGIDEELALIRKNRAPIAGEAPAPPATGADTAPAAAPVATPPRPKTAAEIDAEMGLPPRETGLASLPAEDAGFFEVMGAAWRAETIRTDAWNHAAVRRMDLVSEMYQLLSPASKEKWLARYSGRGAGREFVRGQGWAMAAGSVMAIAAEEAATNPDAAARWSTYPLTTEALDQRILSDRIADLDEAEAITGQSGGGFAELLGSGLRSMTDETSVMLMPFGLQGGVWRKIAGEAALGALGEAAVLPKEYRVAEELGLPDPGITGRLAMGAAFGGIFAAGIHGLGRGYTAFKARTEGRTASLKETQPEGVDRVDHEAEVDAAEAQLRGDQTPTEAFDWQQHRSQGGLREDAITGLDPEFRTGLEGMIASAPPHIRDGLSVFSGYRSIERQQELWDASDKSGKMVARPGRSKHNHGQAVDLEWHGQRLDKAPPEVQAWVAANLEKFGLTRPMDYEPWHVEPIGARGGKASTPAPILPEVGPDAPEDWARIRNGIFAGESGADWNALFGYQNRKGGKFSHIKPSEMTVDQWLEFQDPNGEYGQWVKAHRPDPENGVATPMGAYQITGTTLRDLKRDLGLKGDEVMDAEFQDYLAQKIYRRQGAGAWQGYKGPRDSYTAGSVDGPAPDFGPTTRGYTGQGQVAVGDDTRIDVDYEVVDYRSLIKASGDLQPRDRTRINSDEWVAATAARLDPAQLMPSPTADRGTPIVGPDGVIESGNGRSMAIARAYERHPDRAEAYRGAIEAAGFTIPDGVQQPVLIARRRTELSPDARRRLVIDAQDSGVAQMTPTEVARATAQGLQAPILSRLDPSQPLGSDANGGFVRAALATLPRSARNAMFDPGGALNALGQRQLKEAIFARAWPDPDILARYTEGAPAELKSLMEALEAAAPNWAALKADIEAGLVAPEMDISGFVVDAMRLIGAARELAAKGTPVAKAIAELLDEVDMLAGTVSPLTAALVKKMWRNGRAAPADEVAGFLTRYADEARKAGLAGGMFDAADPRDVLRAIDPEAFGNLPEDLGQVRGFARPGQEAPAEAVRDLPGGDFDQGAQSPAAEALHAEIMVSMRGPDVETLLRDLEADPDYVAAMERQAAIEPTTEMPGYGTDAFWQQRRYIAPDGAEITGLPTAVEHLTEVSRTLAWAEDGLPPEPIRRERQAVILIGPPAAGKSAIANPLARSRGAAILDADEAKKLIPEYGKGDGANAVHEESGHIARGALRALVRDGANLVLPKVGGSPGSIEGLISSLKRAGYGVDLVEVVAPADVVLGRMTGRGKATGRYIPVDVVRDGIDGAPRTYQVLKEKGAADGYARIDNAPGRGQDRGILEDDRQILDAFGRGDGSDRNAPAGRAGAGVDRGRRDQARGEDLGTEGAGREAASGSSRVATPTEPSGIAISRPSGEALDPIAPKRGLIERASRFLSADTRAIDKARRDLGEFADLEIDLPDGTTARAGDILDDLDSDRAADAFIQACAISQGRTA